MNQRRPLPESRPASCPGRSARMRPAGLLLACLAGAAVAGAPDVKLGAGGYRTTLKSGDGVLPVAEYVTGDAVGKAAPTNQWYSSVMFQRWSQPLHAHPMTYRATEQGFELGLPTRRFANVNGSIEIQYPHVAAVTVAPLGFQPKDARLARFSDWLAQISLGAGADEELKATVLHGSPFSYYECSKGDVRLRFASTPQVLANPTDAGRDARVAAVSIGGQSYAVFAPTGATWQWNSPTELVLHLPAATRYFSVAGLPDGNAATLADFLAVAYAFPTETRVEWHYDEATSKVRSVFRVQTEAREGKNLNAFMGLYPHQWSSVVSDHPSQYGYDTVRGRIRLVAGNSFTLERSYHGIVPMWGPLEDASNAAGVESLLVGDLAKSDQLFGRMGRGTYWIGKGLGATAQLMSVAEAQGKLAMRDQLLAKLKNRLEGWLDGEHSTYFVQDARIGTFVGVPQEYNSINAMNDHHFHYGYWLTAAAHVALRDPAWAAADQWGGMVGRIIADVASAERGRSDFPFLRNFDAYEGHSWASGNADFDAGNNQESSSEAVNAWAGLILWGEATGDRAVRDLGMFLYTSEIASVQQYWFDLDRQVLAPEFGKPFASMVFGGKYAYNTWWTQEPRQIMGINLLPLTPASTYLGADPQYVGRLVADLPGEVKAYEKRGLSDGTPPDIWQDVIAGYAALGDPEAGAALWSRSGSVEAGDTRSRTLYWLSSLKEMGMPDFSVTADTPLYAVFRDRSGRRTYLAYNASATPRKVTFSDGKSLQAGARSLTRAH